MKKFFYFSDKKLEFIEIKNFKRKTIFSIVFLSSLLSLIIFLIYFLIQPIFNQENAEQLLLENKILKNELKVLKDKYASLETELEQLKYLGNNLRNIVNLKPLKDGERILGKGGSILSNELIKNLRYKSDISKSFEAIETIIDRFEFEKNEFSKLEEKILENQKFFESVPVLIPTSGEYSSDDFGMRFHPILKYTKMHEGIDIQTSTGSPVFAPGAGVVSYVGRKPALGICMEIDHGFGYKTVYGHLSKILVKEGQSVKRGNKIALTGNTGLSTGPHLHYEVHLNGIPQDPVNYFLEHSNTYLKLKKLN